MVDEGLQIVKANRELFDGRRRSPWNDVECGDHYARPMSSWSLLEAVSGFRYSAPENSLTFAPKFDQENFRCFFITAAGWGSFSRRTAGGRQVFTLEPAYGEVGLRALSLQVSAGVLPGGPVTVHAAGNAVEADVQFAAETISLTFSEPLTLTAGQVLEVTIAEGGQ